jgi:hypothetical protein
MASIDNMYNEFVRYFERMSQMYKESVKSIEKINQLYTESIQNVEKMNELYKDIQRTNQDWLELFWRPWLTKDQEKQDKTRKK